MTRFFSFFIILCILNFFFIPIQKVDAQEGYFIVTAYYSPLPNQEYYATGNYEDEVILNGRWVAGASWKPVFSGMLAAPWKYSFGTKIYLEWLGIWEVSDRWGAIVQAGQRWYEYDRIDVWMGYGDEWLRRANYWWKRKVPWYVANRWSNVTLNYQALPAPNWAISGLYKSYSPPPAPTIYEVALWHGDEWNYVEELQKILTDLSYLPDTHIPWVYGDVTKDAIYRFQLQNKIVYTIDDRWAWYYGPQTRKTLKTIYEWYKQYLNDVEEINLLANQQAWERMTAIGDVAYGDISPQVRELQKLLGELWYFHVADTAIFWTKTQNALIEYQQVKNIIQEDNKQYAWIFWPKTKESLLLDIIHIHFEQLKVENNIIDTFSYTPVKIDTPEQEDEILQETTIFSI